MPVPLLFVWALSWGCATSEARLGDTEDASTSPVFQNPSDGDAAVDSDLGRTPLMCKGTECPSPFATCAAESGPAYKCGTDLSSDSNNCGACGNKCLTYEPLRMNSRCVDGACEVECRNSLTVQTDYRNCNGKIDDGCEVDAYTDHDNCGACGHKCGDKETCINGQCGCPAGLIACPDSSEPSGVRCLDPKTDDDNCGACGHACWEEAPPAGSCDPSPPGMNYGCVAGTCGHLKCGQDLRDCNNDVGPGKCDSDGCEVDVTRDPNNCGGCGIKCVGAEECIDEGNGWECAVPCVRSGKSMCPNGCADLLGDPSNCGGCDNNCGTAGPNEVRSCKKGRCSVECATGFADCNGDPSDGCEANLLVNPGNCGTCGNQCDVGAGQPCIEGKCLMTECTGETR
ncbi:Tryptophan synthase alpha chain [Labilithrix luteola]|uniref:Tryptophan synthase alpha chain n=1 Tax=Labilithrix luteola TaxID=1391654 RepID=A0A0K1PXY8_9BACT|nr:hypothetical protein [Labilithrix luteola]AKU98231.1 Tryptophan synthase alpha chain [Labilithrix luteola]